MKASTQHAMKHFEASYRKKLKLQGHDSPNEDSVLEQQ